MVKAFYGVQFKGRKRGKELVLKLGLNETIDHLTKASSVHWHSHVTRMKDGHFLRRAIEFDVDCQEKKGRQESRLSKEV